MSRRHAIGAMGSLGLGAVLAACGRDPSTRATPSPAATATGEPAPRSGLAALFDDAATCSVTAEQAEGPYYFDADAIRRDIRGGRPGTSLRLGVRVRDAARCEPLRDAVVDVWHCDAEGVYSGFGEGEGERFLRGTQVTDRDGIAEFLTVYPGWYPGRTVHIHAKVHLDRRTVLTTQFYFDEAVSQRVFATAPYRGAGDVANADDAIFDDGLMLTLRERGDGYLGLITLDVRA